MMPIPFISASLNGGFIGSVNNHNISDQGNISSFLTALSINGTIGAGGDIAGSWSPLASKYIDHTSAEFGGLLPYSLGVSATYNFLFANGLTLFGKAK
jgi:hypothetical protein